jgi:heme-degrading monooxygenase HmoA
MPYVLIQHNVASYQAFEPVFDADETRRRRSGSQGGRLFRNPADPNNLFALFEWDTLESARRFADSYELREAVEWASDPTPPRVTILEEVKVTAA